jgi:hypothetical protein
MKNEKIQSEFVGEIFSFNLDGSKNACPEGSFGCIFDSQTGKLKDFGEKMSISYDAAFSSLQFEITNFQTRDFERININLYCDEKEIVFDPTNDVGIFSFIDKNYVAEVYSAYGVRKIIH